MILPILGIQVLKIRVYTEAVLRSSHVTFFLVHMGQGRAIQRTQRSDRTLHQDPLFNRLRGQVLLACRAAYLEEGAIMCNAVSSSTRGKGDRVTLTSTLNATIAGCGISILRIRWSASGSPPAWSLF